jgi:hypothetical protein
MWFMAESLPRAPRPRQEPLRHGYYATGEKAGQAWNVGSALAKAALGR